MYLKSSGIQVIIEIIIIIKIRRNLNLEVGILLPNVRWGTSTTSFHLWENQAVGSSEALTQAGGRGKVAQRGNVGGKGSPRPGSWEGAGQAGRSGEGEAMAHVLVGDRGTMGPLVIVQDPSPPTPSFPACPLCGLDRVAAWGRAGGHEWAPCLSLLGVGQAPRAHYARYARPGQPPWPPHAAG